MISNFVIGDKCPLSNRDMTIDQITIKTPNPKGRLFLKIDMHIELYFGGESKISR
jgi:hypothetical protein